MISPKVSNKFKDKFMLFLINITQSLKITQLCQSVQFYGEDRDSSVGTATGYGLDGPGIESRWGRDFSHTSHAASCTMGTGSFTGIKWPGRGADHPPPSSAEVTNEYSYISTAPSGTSGPAIRRFFYSL
jgi:hypothetical protein